MLNILCVPKCTANLYCICFSILQISTSADAVQIWGKFLGHSAYEMYAFGHSMIGVHVYAPATGSERTVREYAPAPAYPSKKYHLFFNRFFTFSLADFHINEYENILKYF